MAAESRSQRSGTLRAFPGRMPVSATPSTSAPPTPRSARPEPRRRFEEALRRAEADPALRPRAPARRPARPLARSLAERRPAAPSAAAALPPPPTPTAPPGIPELQAAVRAAPPAIAAAVVAQGTGQLALTFGAALSVDLRTGAQGLEVSLRPAPALERAARAELPRLVEALRARGLRVARAAVKARAA